MNLLSGFGIERGRDESSFLRGSQFRGFFFVYPKNPWTLQWKGLKLYSRGVFGSSKSPFLRGQDS